MKNILFRSAKHNMSSKIVGWLVGDWDGKKSDLKKIWIKKNYLNWIWKGGFLYFCQYLYFLALSYFWWPLPGNSKKLYALGESKDRATLWLGLRKILAILTLFINITFKLRQNLQTCPLPIFIRWKYTQTFYAWNPSLWFLKKTLIID